MGEEDEGGVAEEEDAFGGGGVEEEEWGGWMVEEYSWVAGEVSGWEESSAAFTASCQKKKFKSQYASTFTDTQ